MSLQVTRRGLLGATAMLAASPRPARAQAARPRVKLGVLTDMSGPYRDVTGPTSVACARQAAEDFGGLHGPGGFDVEVIAGDHQNKPDVGIALARQWLDRDGVDVILDVPTSSVALGVNQVCREKNKAYINNGAGTTDLTGKACTPVTVHWAFDTYMLAASTAGALSKAGANTWFFVTADYVFGHQLQRDSTAIVEAAGGKVLGAAPYPFPETTDFSGPLVQAQSSGAKVIGLANAGNDTVNCVKQAHEFGLTRGGTKLAALLGSLGVFHALGTETAQGLLVTESFYWDMNDRTRAFLKRLLPKAPTNYPNAVQASVYAGALHFLKSVAAVGADKAGDGAAIVARMKAVPAEDDCFGSTVIRADGRAMVPAYLWQVKTPDESKGEWDLYKLVATTAPEEAAPPASACPLVHAG
jgi:branched-chain amino acid transport system substrate-binding protein